MYTLDYSKYSEKIREVCAESCVLLKNENDTLPIKKEEIVSIFGRSQIETYYCGTGSGGMVNIPYLVNIVEGIREKRKINEGLLSLHTDFIQQHPFDKGEGWAKEPFSQDEFPLTEEIVKDAKEISDVAVMVIGRSAGEDKDVLAKEGSYYLSQVEIENMKLICKWFEKTVILLNVGGVMDMSFATEINPSAIIYAWHGGTESGNGYADVLCGDVNPSGAMPDSIAYKLDDYPSSKNFGDKNNNDYEEDIFVGYRYFETFAQEKIQYPFGYSLSYTDFTCDTKSFSYLDGIVTIEMQITNIGAVKGKKTVQIYETAPIDRLCKAKKVLCSFKKTKELLPNESQVLTFIIDEKDMASFDEKNSAFILEKGIYTISVGFDSSSTKVAGTFELLDMKIIETVNCAMGPIKEFSRMISVLKDGTYQIDTEKVPLRTYNIQDRIEKQRKEILKQTDFHYTFDMVKKGEITVDQFVNDLSDLELIHMTRGEGMCSPKVTAGTAGAIGGVTEQLQEERKIPIACCADGPSGIRMDCGTMAMSIPNGTALASTFNPELSEELFHFVAREMVKNNIDTLLGPGMNIHRTPLCGRNFEYFSEDPLLTGKMAAAQIKTMNQYHVTGTIKHFALNNQEFERKMINSTVSERAIREIYLKGFEIAVKEGGAYSVMTAYNPINGIHAASNFDLNTVILRDDWGFDGIVMTDWWATMNREEEVATMENTCEMIRSQNDLYMVTNSAVENGMNDNSEESLKKGTLSRYELVRTGKNIISTLLRFQCSKDPIDVKCTNVPENTNSQVYEFGTFQVEGDTEIDCSDFITKRSTSNKFNLAMKENGRYGIDMELFADAVELAQVPMTIFANSANLGTVTLKGQTAKSYHVEFDMYASINEYIELFFGETGMVIKSLHIRKM